MKRMHEPKRKQCASTQGTDLPWIEFLRLILMVGALVFFALGLSLLLGDANLVTMTVLLQRNTKAQRYTLSGSVLNDGVFAET